MEWGPCPHFEKGFCKYGDQCRYEHSSDARTHTSSRRHVGEGSSSRAKDRGSSAPSTPPKRVEKRATPPWRRPVTPPKSPSGTAQSSIGSPESLPMPAEGAAVELLEIREQRRKAAIQAAKDFLRGRRVKEGGLTSECSVKAIETPSGAARSRSPLRRPPPPPKSNRAKGSGQRPTPPPPPRVRSRSVISGPEGSRISRPKLLPGPQLPPPQGEGHAAGSSGIVKPKFDVKVDQPVPKVPPQIVQPKFNLEFNYSVAQKGMGLKRGSVDLPSVIPDQPLNISGKLTRQTTSRHLGEDETPVPPSKESLASMHIKEEDPTSKSSVPEASSSNEAGSGAAFNEVSGETAGQGSTQGSSKASSFQTSNPAVLSNPVSGQEEAEERSGVTDRLWMSHDEILDLEYERLKKEEQQQEEDLRAPAGTRLVSNVVATESVDKPEVLTLRAESTNVKPAALKTETFGRVESLGLNVHLESRPGPSDSRRHHEPASAAVRSVASATEADGSGPIQREGYRIRLRISEDPDAAAYRIITIQGESEAPLRVHCTRRILECVLLVWRCGFRLSRLMSHLPGHENRLISFPPVMKEQLSHVVPGSVLEIVFEPDPQGCQAEVDYTLLKCLLAESQYTERSCQYCDPTRPMRLFQEKRPSGRGLVLTPDLRLRSFAAGVPGKDVLRELHQEGYPLRGLCQTKGHWMTVPLELRVQPRGFLLVWPAPIQD